MVNFVQVALLHFFGGKQDSGLQIISIALISLDFIPFVFCFPNGIVGGCYPVTKHCFVVVSDIGKIDEACLCINIVVSIIAKHLLKKMCIAQ